MYDFTASDEMPCAVAFHPLQQVFACGFSSGMVRTFSLAASDLLMEHKYVCKMGNRTFICMDLNDASHGDKLKQDFHPHE